jgi:excisionase family DNA binding protein
MEERHVPLSTVAGRLGVSERTVRRWIKAGKLRAYRPGRDYRIPESALREFVEESEISPKAPAPSPEPSLLNGLEDERRTSEYQRWADVVGGYAAWWEHQIEAGDVDPQSAYAYGAFLEHVQPTLMDLGLQEKREQPPSWIHTYGPIMTEAIMRLYHLTNSFIGALMAKQDEFDSSQLAQLQRKRDEQEATLGEAVRRGA